MPELPEVETQVGDLQEIIGRKIVDVKSDTPKSFEPRFQVFLKKILNKKILTITRRAKYIVFCLSGNLVLIIHFRMTGHFLLAKSAKPLEKFIRHQFKLSGKIWLQFSDIRKFGTLELYSKNNYEKESGLIKLGPEPLEESFTFDVLKERFKKKKGVLKAILLDQAFIAGVGNIYADEICFGASLHPESRVEKFNDKDIKKLYLEIKKQLKKGIKNRGTTIGEYVDTKGEGGKNQLSLMAYKRHGLPCKICGTKMLKTKVMQRTTSFCPKCQKKLI